MTKTLERHGLLIFFISILMVTQLRWAEIYNYNNIAQRLSAAVLIGALLNWGLGNWLTSFEEQTENEKWQRRIKDISFTLSFSFLWVAFHQDGQLGSGIVFLFLIYLVKSNDKAITWLTRFLNSKNFEVELDETKEHPMVLIKGKHDPDNLVAFQYLCVDLSEIFFEMKKKKMNEAQLDLQVTNTTNEQLLPLIRAIADSHGIELST
jgi:Na+-transporting methylmalonyl-CoA/oxaloacetate decarboxylase gamma subunit